jgi:hypothetical protein
MSVSNQTKKSFFYTSFFVASVLLGCVLHGSLREINSRVVSFDSDWVIAEMIQAGTVDPKKIESIDKVSACLSNVIEQYAAENKVVIIPKKAVIAGGKDVSHEIQSLMNKRCMNNA